MGHARDPTDDASHFQAGGRAREAVAAHLEALGTGGDPGAMLTGDVVLTIMETGEVFHGRTEVIAMLTYVHRLAFSAPPVVKALFVADDHAVVEAEFIGRHTSEFAGIPTTGSQVHLPYVVAYDLEADAIRAIRLYLSMDTLVRQLRET